LLVGLFVFETFGGNVNAERRLGGILNILCTAVVGL
jgi:hypothetical protein